MSTKQQNWKGVMANAINGQDVKTPLLKLARLCYNACNSKEPDQLCELWMKHAEDTCKWALSNEAGDLQLLEMADVPPLWVKGVREINTSFDVGVDFTKINSYTNMLKMLRMLSKQSARLEEGEAEPEGDDSGVPILDEPDADTEGGEPAGDDEPAGEEHEPEPKKDPAPKPAIDPDEKISNEDAQFAAAVVEQAIKSGQVLDPENIVLCPVALVKIVTMLDDLTDGKRTQLEKSIVNLVKAQHDNHLEELKEGKRRASGDKVAQQKKAKADALAKKAAEKKKADAKAPPKRTAAKDDPATGGEFSDQFASMIGGDK